jgi:hypothetical protein
MVGDSATVRARVADDQPRADRSGRPTATRRNSSRKPSLPVERADEFVHVDDGRLELDHYERALRLVPGEKIDDAALAVDGEGDFSNHDPAGL